MKILGTDFVFFNVSDFAKSKTFYQDILGLKLTHVHKDRWAEFETGNMTLCIGMHGIEPDGGKEKKSASVALAVADVKAALEEAKAKGVRVSRDLYECGVCFMAVILDPDGNQVILHHRKDGTVGQD